MTITSVAAQAGRFTALRGELDTLQRQLGTGAKAETYAGLGLDRAGSLGIRAKLSALEGYDAAIGDATLRLKVMGAALTRLTAIGADTRADLVQGTLSGNDGPALARSRAEARMREAIDLLNQEVSGRRVFAGRAADAPPVESYDRIMNGDPATGRDGLRQLIEERQAADIGDGRGRLALAQPSPTSLTLTEGGDTAGQPIPFGFGLASASGTGSALRVTQPSGSPATLGVDVTGLPLAGDALTLTLDLPDGTTSTLTLTARAQGAGPDSFVIGATPEITATNLKAALNTALGDRANTALAAASAAAAAEEFFAASSSQAPRRVAVGTPADPAGATAFEPAATARPTVLWYRGEEAASPRETAPVRVDATTTLATGAQANEPALRDLMAALGTLAANGSTDNGRFAALAERVAGRIDPEAGAPTTGLIASQLGIAQAALAGAKERHQASAALLTDTLSGIERADPESTATAILDVQNRLQASYQTTAMLSRLSLVNYL